MSLLDLFNKKAKTQPPQESKEAAQELDIYSGMRVEVTTHTGQILFVAKLLGLHGNKAELHQYSESEIAGDVESIHVRIRGYSDYERKAVYMEGVITPGPKHIWQVEELTVLRVGNDRAFFRLNTDIDGSMVIIGKVGAGEEPCKLLNISVGGAYVRAEPALELGERFLLQVKLHPDRDMSLIYSEVCRIIEKEDEVFEYGCQFVELNEADQKQIIQAIYERQRKKKHGS